MHRPHQPNPALQTTQTLALLQLAALTEWERTYRELLGLALVVSPFPEQKAAKRPLAALIAEKTPAEETVLVWEFVIWRDVHIYDQKFFDDRNSWVKAPNLRTVAMTGVAILATVASGGVGGGLIGALTSAGINFAGQAAFVAADVATGQLKAEDAMWSLGKSALTSVASVAIGTAFSGGGLFKADTMFGGGLNSLFGDSTIGTMLAAGAQSATNRLASTAINAWDKDGWHADRFTSSWSNVSDYAEIAGAMVQAGVSTKFGNYLNGSGGKNVLGFGSLDRNGINAIVNTTSGLASNAVKFAMGGDASFNLLNFGDFNGGKINGGLLELHFSQKDGATMNMGSGGMDLGLNNWASIGRGFGALAKNAEIAKYVQTSGLDASVALRNLYSYGDKEGQTTLNNILSGKDRLVVGGVDKDKDGQIGQAQTKLNEKGGRDIHLKDTNSLLDQISLAITLQHESYRDGIKSLDNEKETERAVLAHTEMAAREVADGLYRNSVFSNTNLMDDLNALISVKNSGDFSKYVKDNYDSSSDFWKVYKRPNGTILGVTDDGDYKHITVVDADGKEKKIDSYQANMRAQISIAVFGDESKVEEVGEIMRASGLDWDDTEKTWYAATPKAMLLKDLETRRVTFEQLSRMSPETVKNWVSHRPYYGKPEEPKTELEISSQTNANQSFAGLPQSVPAGYEAFSMSKMFRTDGPFHQKDFENAIPNPNDDWRFCFADSQLIMAYMQNSNFSKQKALETLKSAISDGYISSTTGEVSRPIAFADLIAKNSKTTAVEFFETIYVKSGEADKVLANLKNRNDWFAAQVHYPKNGNDVQHWNIFTPTGYEIQTWNGWTTRNRTIDEIRLWRLKK